MPESDQPTPPTTNYYAPAWAVHAEGERIGLATCLRCGAVVLLSSDGDSAGMHDAWHTPEEADRG